MTPQTANKTTATTAEPRDTIIDPLRSRILNELRAQYSQGSKAPLIAIAKNLAFLVRHYAGAEIAPTRISVLFIDIMADGELLAHELALVVHEKGGARVLLQHRGPEGHQACLLADLDEMVEVAIYEILATERAKQKPFYDIQLEGDGTC